MSMVLDLLNPNNLKGGRVETVSLDTSLLPTNTLKYMWSGELLDISYPIIDSNGNTQIIHRPAQQNGLRFNDQFDINRQKTPIVYFTCKNTQRLYIYGYDKDLIQCEIIVSTLDFDFTISCVGEISVLTHNSSGNPDIFTYSDLSDAPVGKANWGILNPAIAFGNIIKLSSWNNTPNAAINNIFINSDVLQHLGLGKYATVPYLDLTRVPKLKILELNSGRINKLNIAKNPELQYLILDTCTKLSTIYALAKNSSVASQIALHISQHPELRGIIYCNPSDAYYSTIAVAAENNGWTILPLE